ncbi:hypothetical protein N7448_004423 [Penicillium atrosanguineum]|uniref:NAD(P)-binding domain-containing protein n=1 Tax=Penicillium atrosanguineum TaxID=1132637 RepID=A0A9W9PXT3_9EURO|nr:uncharacterized protein N7443_003387 [Penicillium atrosanguineum]KAJ5117926.1 hypothetical protein N7526_010949 [Penicillium atrosanguineum]KAJ5141015.1 hypothetical protein N7448_004423 [Penicillium atrosanguineum]KAJ5310926.1 hypothetical protein N7443_003387 [Penicillium atrosanguineum]KAJ5316451.1 hypothetical protein N7476_006758 [Penicillium atrosanguineum]
MITNYIEKVATIGATGRIGSAFAKALLQTGKHQVTALIREDSKGKLSDAIHAVQANYENEGSCSQNLHKRITTAAGKAGVSYIMPNAHGYPVNPESDDLYGKAVLNRINDTKKWCITLRHTSVWVLDRKVPFSTKVNELSQSTLGKISYEPLKKRITDSKEELAQDNFRGFVKLIYGGVFLPSNRNADFAATMTMANDILNLPKEDLDEATKRTVAMVDGVWDPFGFRTQGNETT